MSRTLTLLSKLHPLTGEPIRAIGVRPDGRPLWPILGGDPSNDAGSTADRPDDVSEEEWDALGDPGKQALIRVRHERDSARSSEAEAKRQLAAARARPTAPPKTNQPGSTDAAGATSTDTGDKTPDLAQLITQAVDAAVKPLRDAEDQRTATEAANRVRSAVLEAAKPRLLDSTDALQIDLATVIDDNGAPDVEKITQALDGLLDKKPHLAKSDTRFAPQGIGGGQPPAGANQKERVAAILSDMQRSAGIRMPSTN